MVSTLFYFIFFIYDISEKEEAEVEVRRVSVLLNPVEETAMREETRTNYFDIVKKYDLTWLLFNFMLIKWNATLEIMKNKTKIFIVSTERHSSAW